MKALRALTLANIRGYLRDRQALFWTLAFPLIFVVLFGAIFSGGDSTITVAWVDQDASPASAQLRAAFASAPNVKLVDTTQEAGLEAMKTGENSGVIVVPKGYAAVVATAGLDPTRQTTITYYIDPSQQTTAGTMVSYVNGVIAQVNLGGRPVAIVERSPADPDRAPERGLLPGPEHPRDGPHADRDLRRHPDRGRPPEAHPQAAGRDAPPALAADRLERDHADAHRARPVRAHRRRRGPGLQRPDRREPAGDGRPGDPRLAGLHGPGLRDRHAWPRPRTRRTG